MPSLAEECGWSQRGHLGHRCGRHRSLRGSRRSAILQVFRREQAISFKEHLGRQRNPATGKPLAKATLYGTLEAVRAFFEWLAREPGYRKALVASDAAYFNPSDNDMRVATAARERPAPSLEQVRHVLSAMPTDTVVDRRDRAVVAFTLLTGARDAAVASFRLKHVDVPGRSVSQDAREVRTKRAKSFTTAFFPVVRRWRRLSSTGSRSCGETICSVQTIPCFPPPKWA